MTLNQFKTSIQLSRIDICDLIIACEVNYEDSGEKRWDELRVLLQTQLSELNKQLTALLKDN